MTFEATAGTRSPVGPAHDTGDQKLREHAMELRRVMMRMASDKGEGYIAQGLGIADMLAVVFYRELVFDAKNPEWPERDRFVSSTGHYSLALYAALYLAGYLPEEQLDRFGLNGSELALSTFDDVPGVEVTGGSLGHGLGQAVGMALGNRLDANDARVICELSDGELQEGSVWESAMVAASFKLDRLVVLVDCNGIQADGPMVINIEPVADKWTAFGWETIEVDGNSIAEIVDAFNRLREENGRPKVIILRTTPGKGIPTLERRERAHFVRVGQDEWTKLHAELENNYV